MLLGNHIACTLFIKSIRQRNLSTFWLLAILKLAILLHIYVRYNGDQRQLGNINWPIYPKTQWMWNVLIILLVRDFLLLIDMKYVRILSTKKNCLSCKISHKYQEEIYSSWHFEKYIWSYIWQNAGIEIFCSKDFLTILTIPLVVAWPLDFTHTPTLT